MAHAVLSPSSASRWLECTPSARLEQQFPDKAGAAAAEGTLAHSLGELLIAQQVSHIMPHMKPLTKAVFDKELAFIKSNLGYTTEMLGHMENYASFVMERFYAAQVLTSDAMIYLEQRLDMTDYVPEGFGTGDVVIIADGTMQIIDLKYGKGVPVSAEENKQMMLYALGALRDFDYVYSIDKVNMVIYQPRLDSISEFGMLVDDLKDWASAELLPRAKLAFAGEGNFKPGAHCRFCKVAATCRANAEQNLEIAKYEFKDAVLLTDLEIADILDRADQFSKWIGKIEEHALSEAVAGKQWPGYKLVEGRSNRKFSDEQKVISTLWIAGYKTEDITNTKLKGITDLTGILSKGVFNQLIGDYLVKPPGKPTLVPESDKRPVFVAAADAFADVQPDDYE